MKGVREKVNRLDELKFVAMLAERGEIARQGGRIARDIEDHRGAERGDVGLDPLGAGTGRVEDDLGKVLSLLFELRDTPAAPGRRSNGCCRWRCAGR